MPPALAAALVLLHTLFAITLLGGLGLLLTADSYDAVDGHLLALTAYAAAPGTLGWWLARRTWQGGGATRLALIAVQVWLLVGAATSITAGSPRGFTQLFLPALILYFLTRPDSRAWYRLPDSHRAERRSFSLPRMIRRRRDEGQTAVEYAGLVAVVAAIITALLVSGLGPQTYRGLQSAVCKVTGTACPADPAPGDGTDPTTAHGRTDDERGATAPEADGGHDPEGGGNPGTGTGGGEGRGEGGDKSQDESQDESQDKGQDGDSGAEDHGETTPARPGDEKDDDGCLSGVGAFFGCAGDQVKQVGEGLFVDGIGGEIKGVSDTVANPLDSLKGLKDYGGVIADQWSQDSEDAGDKWAEGDHLDALTDWGGATVNSGGKILDDMFVGEDVRDQWNQGNETRAVTTVIWNVGSLFIPGYGEAKIVGKAGKLGELGKLGDLGRLTDKAVGAAGDARKAAKAGDAAGARRAAEEADEAADEAERKARESGCPIAAPPRRAPFGGGPGTGTTVLAASRAAAPYVVLAEDGCDEEAERQAREARRQADEADKAADEAERATRPVNDWQAGDDIPGPARGKVLKFPNKRHTVGGASGGQVKERNTVILRGNEDLVRADIEGIANGRATLSADGNTYEINGRAYEVEGNGTVFPKSGPGLVQMDRIEYAALKEIARNKGDAGTSRQLQRDPKFVDNPDKVAKAKAVYDGTYR
ncbi:Flp family type IVb pilin [Streptomyces sp. AHA2]|uniref:Flp family type IVb pilin n=1 Tax=Streptomyces sp. AHA2 TaxID=3064526 RepID=UPI002FE25062